MAPAQSLDIPQTPNSYTHKKFKGNRYAHKKFGTRTPSPPAPTHHHLQHITQGELIVKDIKDLMVKEDITTTTPNNKNNKRSSGDIFRPYALDDDNTARRKRKLEELHRDAELEEEEEEPQLNITKRFAPSPVMENVMSPQPLAIPHFNPALIPFIPPPNYRLQQYQFNAQTFALVLQKQQAALCMGQILKRQNNINLYNIMGN